MLYAENAGESAPAEAPHQPGGLAGGIGRVGEGDIIAARSQPFGVAQRIAPVDDNRGAETPRRSMLARSAAREGGFNSTKSALAAPRDSASSPRAPLPAKRSTTRAPGSESWRMLIQASRTRSAVGRTRGSRGDKIVRPPIDPTDDSHDYAGTSGTGASTGAAPGLGASAMSRACSAGLPHVGVLLEPEGHIHDRRSAGSLHHPRHPVGPLETDGGESHGAVGQSPS